MSSGPNRRQYHFGQNGSRPLITLNFFCSYNVSGPLFQHCKNLSPCFLSLENYLENRDFFQGNLICWRRCPDTLREPKKVGGRPQFRPKRFLRLLGPYDTQSDGSQFFIYQTDKHEVHNPEQFQ